jgi:hypothetical protein
MFVTMGARSVTTYDARSSNTRFGADVGSVRQRAAIAPAWKVSPTRTASKRGDGTATAACAQADIQFLLEPKRRFSVRIDTA